MNNEFLLALLTAMCLCGEAAVFGGVGLLGAATALGAGKPILLI